MTCAHDIILNSPNTDWQHENILNIFAYLFYGHDNIQQFPIKTKKKKKIQFFKSNMWAQIRKLILKYY
jgi:hypothetical protein